MNSLPITRLALLAAVAASVGGCSFTSQHNPVSDRSGLDYRQRHPIVLTQEAAVLPLYIGTGAERLTPGDRTALASFLSDFRHQGEGALRVQIPSGAANDAAAVAVLHDVHAVVSGAGVNPAAVVVESYPVQKAQSNAPMRVLYDRVAATSNQCGTNNGYIEATAANRAYPNFGCAAQANLAAMLADPRDAVRPRGMGTADPTRRTTVLEAYRRGQDTATQRNSTETATVADVGN